MKRKTVSAVKPDAADDFFEEADVGAGTEFAAVKPWLG
jgi:hypothetical protein